MKNKLSRLKVIVLAMSISITPVMACTTIPHNINISRPTKKPVEKPKARSSSNSYSMYLNCTQQVTTSPSSVTAPGQTPANTQAPNTEAPKNDATISPPVTRKEAPKETQKAELQNFRIDSFKLIQNTLEQLGIKPNELESMIKQGKTLSDVLKDKAINVAKFKKILLREYATIIKEAINHKQITKQEAKLLKKAIKQKINAWEPK